MSASSMHEIWPVEPASLRRVCGLFVTGVTVITTGAAGRLEGTTVNSFTSVSLEPPLVLFCLHKESRLLPRLRESRCFVVNFLASWQEPVARAFARRDTASFDDVGYTPSVVGAPVLSDALAFLACRTTEEFEGGDHIIVLGEVVELGVPRGPREPLVFFAGSFGSLQDERRTAFHPISDG